MFIATNQIKFKLLAVIVAIALIAPMVIMPVGSAHAEEKCFYERVKYLDVEIKVIDGQPMFVYETEEGYEKIPFSMSDLGDYAYADGQRVPLKTQGNSILVPTEEGLVPVPIEEFCVVMIDGEVALIAEENPVWKIVIGRVVVKVVSHAVREAIKDNIRDTTIKRVIKGGKKMIQPPYLDPKKGWVPERRVAWYRGVAVILEKDTNEVVTVFKLSKSSLDKRLHKGKWIEKNWTL